MLALPAKYTSGINSVRSYMIYIYSAGYDVDERRRETEGLVVYYDDDYYPPYDLLLLPMPKKRHRRLATGQFLIVHDIMAHLVQVLGIFLFAMEMDSPSSQSNRKGKYIRGEIE